MTTPNGGQQGTAQALGNMLGQGMPFSAQSTAQAQPQSATGSQQQIDPQFLPALTALVPILSTVAQGIISSLGAQQGQPSFAQPQGGMGGQPQGVSPQFFPGLPFPSIPNIGPGVADTVRRLTDIGRMFGLSAPAGQPQATGGYQPQTAMGGQPQTSMGGQQQLDPQFFELVKLLPGLVQAADGIIRSLSAQQGQPSFAQSQGGMGAQPQGVTPQFLPGLPFFAPPRPENLVAGGADVVRGIGKIFGLEAPAGQPQATGGYQPQTAMGGQPQTSMGGQPQTSMGGQQQLDPQFFELVKLLPGLFEPVANIIKELGAQQGQPSFAQPQGVGPVGAGQPTAMAGWR